MLRLGDFMICNTLSNIQSEGSISQFWNNVQQENKKFSLYVHHTLIYTNCEQCYA